ncbi:MAG: glycosyltransferase family 39 protein [Chloroflexi bacterium]|nr:glycosyltransferase family 39 protein [Chloroflexota bacterium]
MSATIIYARSNHDHTICKKATLTFVFCLLAFILGVYGLGVRSLWGDEAFSLWASRQPVIDLAGGLDAQPPLYHLELAGGRMLWGESVFALRFVSLCCGVLLVAIAGRLGRLIGGARMGAFCAFALAVSPMAIYFEQEARMYALGALLAAGAMLLAVALLRRPGAPARWHVVYVLLSLGALYTHYYTVGILAANTLALLVQAAGDLKRNRDRRSLMAWVLAHGAIALGFGAWFFGLQFRYLGRAATNRANWIPPFDEIVSNLGRGINGLVFGMRAEPGLIPLAVAVFVLALLGLIGLWCRHSTRAVSLVTLAWMAISIAVVALTASPSGIVPDFSPRYLLFVLLPLVVAAGGWTIGDFRFWILDFGLGLGIRDSRLRLGDDHQSRTVRGAIISNLQSLISNLRAIFAVALIALPAVYGDAALLDFSWAKSQYERMTQVIRERYAAHDGVALLNSDQFPLYDYYGPKDASVWLISNDLWDASREGELDQQFDAFVQGKARVWLVNYGYTAVMSPRPRVEQRLNALGARIYHQGFQDATLSLYQLLGAAEDTPFEAVDVRFGEHIQLAGTRWRARQFTPGEVITLDLLWRSDQKLTTDYTVFVHLRRSEDGEQVAAFDSPPMNGAAPTTSWTPGTTITDTHAIQIPTDARVGQYAVVIGLYQYPSFERLQIAGQGTTEYVVGSVQVGE